MTNHSLNLNKKTIEKALKNVVDPELGINIVDLGLIYDIVLDSKLDNIKVIMTLTSPFCPFNSFLLENVKDQLLQLGARKVDIELTFNPLWSPSRISKKIKLKPPSKNNLFSQKQRRNKK